MKMIWRECARLAVAAVVAGLPAIAGAQDAGVLNVYNWGDYIAPDTITNFEKETGIQVRYDNFDSNESLHAKLVAGNSGYDVVVPGAHFARQQIAAGLLRKLDKSRLPNLGNLDPAIQAQLAKMDPGNEYLVDWLWGYTTVGINVDKVQQALGGAPLPDNAWDLVFKPEYAARLKSCGVSILDSASEVMPVVLHYVGKDPHSTEPADYAEAGRMLKAVRPYVTRFVGSGSDYIDQLAKGGICVALGWSGDILIASNRAKENRTGQNIQVLVPKSGGLLFFDVMAIPRDAKNVDNAHKWIDYILRPEVHASLTNTVFFANPNQASLPFVKPEIAGNAAVFPSAGVLETMLSPGVPDQATRRLVTRTFTNFKANR
ncbi:MAG: polyamine ABC transporter substrate-binding protein [Candidatus Accumulibacter sp.]|jgi:putrescine transport system substrate-binding protein|nr:polyamine ABC transporter substrate-binding protein [Accumulibacter sp.]